MINKNKLTVENDGEILMDTFVSDYFYEFIDNLIYMRRLYINQKYTRAEEIRDGLIENLDDLMRGE